MNKKNIIFLIFGAVIIFGIISLIVFMYQKNNKENNFNISPIEKKFVPDFLSSEEKSKLGISDEIKIQVMARDENGQVKVYRAIKNDSDIVNPDQVEVVR